MEEIKCSRCNRESTENIHFCPSCQTLVCGGCFADQECIKCITCESCEWTTEHLYSVGGMLVCEDCHNICQECEYITTQLYSFGGRLLCEDCDGICDECGFRIEESICGCNTIPPVLVNTYEIAPAA